MALALLLPLAAAGVYVVGALLVKRAADLGVGGWATALVSNFVTAVIFQALLPLGGPVHIERLGQPALVGALFLVGQVCNYRALAGGDVSVATPVLGLKILLVAFFTTLLVPQPVSATLWLAAALGSLAVALLGRSGRTAHARVGHTIFWAGASATAFALSDVLLQKWSPSWGAGRFLPLTLAFCAVLNVALLPAGRAPLAAIPRGAWPWLLAGCVCVGLQSLLFAFSIVKFGNATAANVVYSARGLGSVIAVWAIGHWFANREQQLGRGVLLWRFAGAALLLVAIALVTRG